MIRDDQEFIERRNITGMIVSTDYLQRIQKFWNPSLLESPELKIVAGWCMDYFKKYGKAPDSNIQDLYMDALKKGLSKADARYIEELLQDLSDEYGRGTQFNSAYLYDKTIEYFKAREIEKHNEQVQALVQAGEIEKAEQLAASFRPSIFDDEQLGLDLSKKKEAMEAIERAFSNAYAPVVTYPGALGELWNDQLVRGGFVSLLAPEKRGKTFMLLEIGLRAIRQKANVAFFEAGDMTEEQILRRICIYISQRSDKERYCEERFRPVGDCVLNQLDLCDREDRNCDHGIFDGVPLSTFMQTPHQFVNLEVLQQKYEEYPDYEPCDAYGCTERKGTVWLKKIKKCRPLTVTQAKKNVRAFFERYKRRFKLITYPAGTLTISEIRRVLDIWERQDNFVPDVIIIDYADLMSADDAKVSEFRHRQDYIWKSLRGLSQERHVLVVTATQADSESYERKRLTMSNFSEDKRKLSHVTAMYGLNQDPQVREKKLGILRINEIVVREGEFSNDREVWVLQDLAIGRPFLESFFP